MYSENSNAARFRALFTSPAFLTAVIAFTTKIVLSLMQSVFAGSAMSGLLSQLVNSAGLPISSSDLRMVTNLLSGSFGVGTIIRMLPVLYLCTALWLVYGFARKNDGTHAVMNPIGFQLINVYDIIAMVVIVIVAILHVIFAVISFFSLGISASFFVPSEKVGGWLIFIAIFVLLLIIGAYIFLYVFYNKAHKLARQLADSAATGNIQVEVPGFVTVLCYIIGVVTALAAIPGIFLGGVFSGLSSAANATAIIAFAIFLGKLRTGLMTMDSGANDYSYAEPQSAPSMGDVVSPAYTAPDMMQTNLFAEAEAPKPRQLAATAPLSRAILLRQKTGENIQVNAQNFTLGRNPSVANYVIADNPRVSGSHASILTMNGTYYLVDNNSTNHTYVNDTMVQPGVRVPLSNQSIIKLYNEVFVFIIP